MSISSLLLRQFSQFSAWPETSVNTLAEHATLRRLNRRQLVLTPAELGQWVGWVTEGSVWLLDHTLDDRESVLGRFAVGELCGEMHAFGQGSGLPGTLSYVAATACSVAIVGKPALWALIGQDTTVGQQMVTLLAKRMGDFFRWRAILALPSAPERVAAVLEALAGEDAGQGTLPAGTTQQEIAAYANTTRETVTRVMQRLQAEEAVVRDGALWRVDTARLQAAKARLG